MNLPSQFPYIPHQNESNSPATLVESVYVQLRSNIIEGIHAPGEKLRVEHLKEQYNVGGGTLREAMLLLISDALVITQSQKGFRVAPISLAAFEDISKTRVFIETEALRQSITNGNDTWESNVVATFHRLTKAEGKLNSGGMNAFSNWEQYNRAFHEALIAACPSHWLLHFQNILYYHSERYRRLSLSHLSTTSNRDIHKEHQTLFEAALAHDTELATSALTEHVMHTLENIKQLLPNLLNNQKSDH